MADARHIKHLNQIELSDRWGLSHRTLERWRWIGEGPPYLKIGGRVVYRLEDIERYELEQLRVSGPTAQAPVPNAAAGPAPNGAAGPAPNGAVGKGRPA